MKFKTHLYNLNVYLDTKRLIINPLHKEPIKSQSWLCVFEKTELKRFLDFCTECYIKIGGKESDIKPETKIYSEEINVYKDEIERSITTTKNGFSFICYTDKVDDEWTYLTKAKLRYFIELLTPSLYNKKD